MVNCKVVRCTYRTPIIGEYLPPTMLAHLLDLEESLERFWYQYPMLMVNINVDLDESQKPRSQIIADMLTEFFLVNLMHNFQKCQQLRHLKTWT